MPRTCSAAGAGGAGETTLTDGLVAYWPLTEASGVRAESVNGYDLTQSGTEVGRLIGWVEPFGMGPLSFNGNTRLVRDPPDAAFDFGTEMTAACWSRLDFNYNYNEWINQYTGVAATSAWALTGGVNGEVIATVFGNAASNVTVTTDNNLLKRDRWQLIYMWTDSAASGSVYAQVWTRGVASSVYSASGWLGGGNTSINFPATPLRVANVSAAIADHTVTGILGPCAVWNRALTAAEREEFEAAGHGTPHPFTAANTQTLEPTDPLDSVVSNYKMEEASNATRVDTVGPNDLANTGTVAQVAGKVGNAASFDGATDYLTLTSPTGIPQGDTPYSISLWVMPENVTQSGKMILSYGTSGVAFNWDLRQDTTDIAFRLWDGGTPGGSCTMNGITEDVWHHVAIWLDTERNQLKCRMDNGTTVTVAQGTFSGLATRTLVVGGSSGGANLWAGAVDGLYIANEVFNGHQWDALWNGGSGAEP